MSDGDHLILALKIADRLSVPVPCLAPICEALSELPAGAISNDKMQVLFELPETLLWSDKNLMSLCIDCIHFVFGVTQRSMGGRGMMVAPLGNDAAADNTSGGVNWLKSSLVTLFGDVPAVIVSSTKRRFFTQLPIEAVQCWARSDELRVHSESCVVVLLAAWAAANAPMPAGKVYGGRGARHHEALRPDDRLLVSEDLYSSEDLDSSDLDSIDGASNPRAGFGILDGPAAAALRRRVETLGHWIRVLHLSPSFLTGILPSMPWFTDHVNLAQALQRAQMERIIMGQQRHTADVPKWEGPVQWRMPARDVMDLPRLEFEVKPGGLLKNHNRKISEPPSIYVGGHFFTCVASLSAPQKQDDPKPSSSYLSIRLSPDVKAFESIMGLQFPVYNVAIQASVSMLHPSGETAKNVLGHITCDDGLKYGTAILDRLSCRFMEFKLLESKVFNEDLLHPFLFGQKLRFQVQFQHVY